MSVMFIVDLCIEKEKFSTVIRMLKRFVVQKQLLKEHLFGICTLTDDLHLIQPLTSNSSELFGIFDQLQPLNEVSRLSIDLTSITESTSNRSIDHNNIAGASVPCRNLLIFGRTLFVPEIIGTFDLIYIHPKPNNMIQKIYDSLQREGRQYEVQKTKRMALAFTELLGVKGQRSEELKCHYYQF